MSLVVRNTEFKQGRPQVAVSLTGRTPEEIIQQCKEAVVEPIDVIEWRADFYFNAIKDIDQKLVEKDIYIEIIKILDDINYIADDKPVIFTVRSKAHGGVGTLNQLQLESVQQFVAESKFADFIDVEVAGLGAVKIGLEGDELRERVQLIREEGCKVILSYHDFDGMPSPQDIVRLVVDMAKYEGDMFKVAAMADNRQEAMDLIKATAYLANKGVGPLVTMAMGREGAITRVIGGKYGSVMTFASVGMPSAPGQIGAASMKKKLDEFYGE